MRTAGSLFNIVLTSQETARFNSSFKIDPSSNCWLWTKRQTPTGYGRFGISRDARRMSVRAHRLAYAMSKGSFQNEMNICHTCDTPLCVNPQHLFCGTQHDNIQDMIQKGRKFTGPFAKGRKFTRPFTYSRTMSGEKNPRAMLNEQSVKIIAFSNEPIAVLAKRYGVSLTTIGHVRGGRSWGHVTGIKTKVSKGVSP